MRFLAIKHPDGTPDKYAICYATYTVTLKYDRGKPLYEAWKLTGTEPGQAVCLGIFDTSAKARSVVVADSQGESIEVAA